MFFVGKNAALKAKNLSDEQWSLVPQVIGLLTVSAWVTQMFETTTKSLSAFSIYLIQELFASIEEIIHKKEVSWLPEGKSDYETFELDDTGLEMAKRLLKLCR